MLTLILDSPRFSPTCERNNRLKPSTKASSSSTVLFFLPTSPISPPIEMVSPLGSIIISEVIFGALANAGPEQFGSLAELSRNHYPTDVFEGIPDIECMAGLAEFTAETAGLQQAVPAFL